MKSESRPPGGHPLHEYIGNEIRIARVHAGLTQEQLGQRIGYSASLVASLEVCRRKLRPEQGEQLDRALKTDGRFLRFATMSADVPLGVPGWVDVERTAATMRAWHPTMVPGLVQTSRYHAAVISCEVPTLAPTRVDVTPLRNRVTPLRYTAVVLDEVALTRPVDVGHDTASVMVDQCRYLCDLSEDTTVTIRVLPTSAGITSGHHGPFVILGGFDDGAPPMVCLPGWGASVIDGDPTQYHIVWEELSAYALPPNDSRDRITDHLMRWERQVTDVAKTGDSNGG